MEYEPTEDSSTARKPTTCPSPDITEPLLPMLQAHKRSEKFKEKNSLEQSAAENDHFDVFSFADDTLEVDRAEKDNEDQEDQNSDRAAGRGKRGTGRGRKRGRGGRGRGRGRGRKADDSQIENHDYAESLSQIEQNVKDIQLTSGGVDIIKKEVDINFAPENVSGIFGINKEERVYQPGYIPGLDFSADTTPDTNMETNVLDDVKPVADVVAAIKDDFRIKVPDDVDDSNKIRRSSRIKSLEGQKGRGRRREVVFSSTASLESSKSLSNLNDDDCDLNNLTEGFSPCDVSGSIESPSNTNFPGFKTEDDSSSKPFKVKSRWKDSADAESLKSLSVESLSEHLDSISTPDNLPNPVDNVFVPSKNLVKKPGLLLYDKQDVELIEKLRKFQGIEDSIFRKERKISKESKGMVCDCFLTNEDIENGENGCVEDCLNRLLMVECGTRCPTGDRCMNKKFQKKQYATLEVFKTEKKGHGLRTLNPIPEGGFVIEYVGEVLDPFQFENRTRDYAKGNQEHFYFMALKSDSIIDATLKGNCSRFINHSCEPNCETQKWTVNGELRIGFFTLRDLRPGEEIVFDYQFQRYGKKAQRCFCGTRSCRGWIGEEDEDELYEDDRDETLEDTAEAEVPSFDGDIGEVEEEKKKKKVKRVATRKKKDVAVRILEDIALEEELNQLERIGLKNRNHTLTLSRLMVRAEKWDDRERLLNILIDGDPACRRLFLDYRGLKLIYNWMINLPLPVPETCEQVIKNEKCHLLFLKALSSLSISNKTMLLDSKILSLIETWSQAPTKTLAKKEIKHEELNSSTKSLDLEEFESSTKSLDVDELDSSTKSLGPEEGISLKISQSLEEGKDLAPDNKLEAELPAVEKMEVDFESNPPEVPVEEETFISWTFVEIGKSLLESWADLKEVFRIPKKERVEQMKEHEREADKGSTSLPSEDSYSTGSSSYDRDGRSKWGRNGRERRVNVIDSSGIHRQQNRIKDPYAHLSKEQRRQLFAEKVAQEEEDMRQRRMQDEMIVMHQHRCSALGLDPSTTPVVDISGHYYLDSATIQWKRIVANDPSLPPAIKQMLISAKEKENVQQQLQQEQPVEPEYVFPPWPAGLPPPPPLPPKTLPDGWKLAVDDEGRCYYYHIRTRQTQWYPPTAEDCATPFLESSESSDSDAVDDDGTAEENVQPCTPHQGVVTFRTKINERSQRRKKSGLVQERIISPRTEEDKSTVSKAVIRARKLEVLEEKRQSKAAEAELVKQKENPSASEELLSVEEDASDGDPPQPTTTTEEAAPSIPTDEEDEDNMPSSPIETELDISLASIIDDNYESPKTLQTAAVVIPGLGFDPRDRVVAATASGPATVVLKKERISKSEKKLKSIEYKKIASDKSKEAFRNQIANVVVTFLNPYRKPECKTGKIVTTEDFKHLARKMTHAIYNKELKNAREGKPLEVTDSVKQKTKEYVKKFMGRFGNNNYIPSP